MECSRSDQVKQNTLDLEHSKSQGHDLADQVKQNTLDLEHSKSQGHELADQVKQNTLDLEHVKTQGHALQQLFTLTGMFNNLFSQTGGVDYLEWTSNTTPTNTVPLLSLPFNCELMTLTCTWCGSTSITMNSPTEQWMIDIGVVPENMSSEQQNWVSKTGNNGVQTWNPENAHGKYPTIISEDLGISFNKGDRIAVIGFETGSITPNNMEAQVCMMFKKLT